MADDDRAGEGGEGRVAAALSLAGVTGKYLGLAFLLPLAVAVGAGESVWPFAVAGIVSSGGGLLLERMTRGEESMGPRGAPLAIVAAWAMAILVASIPFLLAGFRPVDALFEGGSGMTTTGASIVNDVEGLDTSLAIWRQFTEWLGGLGFVVLTIGLLPRLSVSAPTLFSQESPGPTAIEDVRGPIRPKAWRLFLLYAGFTVVVWLVLAVFGWTGVERRLDPLAALGIAFTSVSTGGFTAEPDSIGTYAPAVQWTVAAFLVLAGTSLPVIWRTLSGRPLVERRDRPVWRDEEVRLYLAMLALAASAVVVVLILSDTETGMEAVRLGVFQVVAIGTTTGYTVADYTLWPAFATVLLLGLMLLGACAGSTSGAIKTVRHLVIFKTFRRELRRDAGLDPGPLAFNGRKLDTEFTARIPRFVLLYLAALVLGTLAVGAAESISANVFHPFDVLGAAASTLGNVGPAFGPAGPAGSYDAFTDASKLVLVALMLIGRLEIIPIAALLVPGFWRGR